MTIVNKKFTVKDDDTSYTLSQKGVGKFLVWWYDEDKKYREVDYLEQTVEEHFSSGNWKFVEEDVKVAEYTGGSSNYYKVFVNNPTTLEAPYEAECNDIIEALKMTFAEGNAFKAIWRKAKARQGVQKKGYDNGLYDSEKVVFFGERMVVEAKSEAE